MTKWGRKMGRRGSTGNGEGHQHWRKRKAVNPKVVWSPQKSYSLIVIYNYMYYNICICVYIYRDRQDSWKEAKPLGLTMLPNRNQRQNFHSNGCSGYFKWLPKQYQLLLLPLVASSRLKVSPYCYTPPSGSRICKLAQGASRQVGFWSSSARACLKTKVENERRDTWYQPVDTPCSAHTCTHPQLHSILTSYQRRQ